MFGGFGQRIPARAAKAALLAGKHGESHSIQLGGASRKNTGHCTVSDPGVGRQVPAKTGLAK